MSKKDYVGNDTTYNFKCSGQIATSRSEIITLLKNTFNADNVDLFNITGVQYPDAVGIPGRSNDSIIFEGISSGTSYVKLYYNNSIASYVSYQNNGKKILFDYDRQDGNGSGCILTFKQKIAIGIQLKNAIPSRLMVFEKHTSNQSINDTYRGSNGPTFGTDNIMSIDDTLNCSNSNKITQLTLYKNYTQTSFPRFGVTNKAISILNNDGQGEYSTNLDAQFFTIDYADKRNGSNIEKMQYLSVKDKEYIEIYSNFEEKINEESECILKGADSEHHILQATITRNGYTHTDTYYIKDTDKVIILKRYSEWARQETREDYGGVIQNNNSGGHVSCGGTTATLNINVKGELREPEYIDYVGTSPVANSQINNIESFIDVLDFDTDITLNHFNSIINEKITGLKYNTYIKRITKTIELPNPSFTHSYVQGAYDMSVQLYGLTSTGNLKLFNFTYDQGQNQEPVITSGGESLLYVATPAGGCSRKIVLDLHRTINTNNGIISHKVSVEPYTFINTKTIHFPVSGTTTYSILNTNIPNSARMMTDPIDISIPNFGLYAENNGNESAIKVAATLVDKDRSTYGYKVLIVPKEDIA